MDKEDGCVDEGGRRWVGHEGLSLPFIYDLTVSLDRGNVPAVVEIEVVLSFI